MGYYIETGPALKGKAEIIAEKLNGEILHERPATYADIPEGKALIVVVDNGIFEAAGFAYSEREFQEFTSPDYRPRRYVLIDREKAEEVTGFKRAKK
jgi:hypothetical protein